MLTLRAVGPAAAALVLLLAGCGGEGGSTGPSTGSLTVTVTGLPNGTVADVEVTGPGGVTREVAATVTLSGLTPGTYTVNADAVTAGGAVYAGLPATQTVTVSEGSTASAASVGYAVSTGTLAVTITGLPAGAAAEVQVTGPDFSRALTASSTLTALTPGTYTVAAGQVSHDGAQYVASPGTQQVAVVAGADAAAEVSYAEGGAAGLNYRIDGAYLTQSVQRYAGTVPLVAGRAAYLRVFVTASEAGAAAPVVRVRFYHAGVPVGEEHIIRGGTTPTVPQEGSLGSSWNLAVPGSLVQPNLSLRIMVDPAGLLPEANEGDNEFPGPGVPLLPEVRTAPQFRVTLIPVVTSVDGRVGTVTVGNKDHFLAASMRMHPLSTFDATVGGALTVSGSVPALEADNGNNAWNTILSQLQARRTADGSTRYYFGVVNPSYSSGVAGIGYVGWPAALGWDKLPSAANIAAHEWGHNWSRQHAPCGGAGNPDPFYPYSGGAIGVYGLDLAGAVLKPATSPDLMGYCGDEWISDYTYTAVMNYRGAEAGVASGLGTAVQPTMIVWGRVEGDRIVLEPAFQAVTRPALPQADGPYRLEARAADGSRVFGLRFAPVEVADDRRGARHFAFAVPLAPDRVARVSSLRLEGEGRSVALLASADVEGEVEVSRVAPGRLALRWDATRTPMVVVRDARTGEVLSFARGGRAEVLTGADELALSLSDRLRSRDRRLRVPAQ